MTNEDFSCDHANTPEQSLEAEARENFVTANVVSWDKKRQFGFVMIDGKRAFIHQSSIIPVYKKPVDFSGSTLVVDRKSISIDPTTKKISVEKAYTETRFQEMSQSLIRRAEDAIRFDRERTKNQLELVSQTTDLQKFIDSMEITPDGLHPGFKQDIRLCISAEEAELKSFDEKNGPVVEFTYTFTCSKNHHEIRLTTTRHVRGWSWAKVSPNPGQIIPNPKTKMVDVAFVLKGANSSHRSLPFLHFSPTCTPPTISDQRIIQTLTIETPLGPIEHEIVLYANPNLERVIFSPSWNGEDIQTLKQEVDARAPSKEAHEQELRRHAAIK